MFKGAIAKGFGHMCYAREDCLGLSCNIPVPLGPKSEVLHASIALVPSELKIEISVMGHNFTIKPNGILILRFCVNAHEYVFRNLYRRP
ncbi:hypothetical protein DPMN_125666 [Dreissena polymorpha]|uniref:Uncharacterized protein n=1 Tax=Dreissena polymorpha TaxID=45954 RepID=A0A9D4GXY2_DREPO|nr:hypothetical protein DPMN_125666 [Dreissena polymorpha]